MSDRDQALSAMRAQCESLRPGQRTVFDVSRLRPATVTYFVLDLDDDYNTRLLGDRLVVNRRSL